MRLPSSVYGYDDINDSLLLILQMNGYLATSFYRIHKLEKQNSMKTLPDSLSLVGWPVPCEVLWKTITKMKASFTKEKVLYLKESFIFQSKCFTLKKVLYSTKKFIYLK